MGDPNAAVEAPGYRSDHSIRERETAQDEATREDDSLTWQGSLAGQVERVSVRCGHD